MSVAEWAETYRFLSPDNSALPGKYSLQITPYLRGILECINDRRIRKVVCQKSAQIGWTDGVINNFIGYTMHMAPAPTIIMFPRDMTAKDYNQEKLLPMLEATPVLADLVPTKTRSEANTQNRKKFPGGFLKLVGSNSTGGVKSTPAKNMIIEEPDDCNLNIKGQGDSIKLLEERGKTYHDHKILAGGTPSIEGVSSIAAEMKTSDRRRYLVPCHECGERHELSWDNVTIPKDEQRQAHEIYGTHAPDKTFYTCPHCGALWTDAQKNRNVRIAATLQNNGWVAEGEFRGVAGFYLNELLSPFAESRLSRLADKYLAAVHEANLGELGALIAFWNSTLGLPWQYQSDLPEPDKLAERAEAYDELVIPWGGLVVTAGVDVQHDRLAVIIRAWGRGEESWLLYWGEIHGATLVAEQGAWIELDELLCRPVKHVSGAQLRIRAVSVDSSDGQTADAVYSFVRKRLTRGFMAVKGASADDGREVFSPARPTIDADRKQKAHKYGLRPFIVGTTRAKDVMLGHDAGGGRIKLTGTGPGRLHWHRGVRADYWEQVLAEIKAPHRTLRHKKVWQKKSGQRNEALDCEVYALHAARSLKINLWREARWSALEQEIRQVRLPAVDEIGMDNPASDPVASADEDAPQPGAGAAVAEPPRPPPVQTFAKPLVKAKQPAASPRGFSATRW